LEVVTAKNILKARTLTRAF